MHNISKLWITKYLKQRFNIIFAISKFAINILSMEITEIKKQLTIRNVLAYYGINTGKKYIYCPFHQSESEKDKKQSMVINDKTNTVYCFSSKCKCGMKAIDVIDFILHKENTDKYGALLKATQLIEQGYIGAVDSLQENSLQNETEKTLSLSPSLSLSVITQHKLQYETETIIYFILGGLPKTLDSLKVTLQINNKQEKTDYSYRTKCDLYEYKQVEKTSKEIAEKLNVNANEVERDLMKLADLVDKYREEDLSKETVDSGQSTVDIIISDKEKQEIETFLQSKNLVEKLSKLLANTGVVGEQKNTLCLFMIGLSIKQNKTLHALVQGSSGSGKTLLIKKIVSCFPENKIKEWTRLSDKVLYNMPKDFLKGMLILIEDMDGLSEEALYALRELMSSGSLKSLVSFKQDNGIICGAEKIVEGPMASFSATTHGEIYEDNMSRVIVLAVDESDEQTDRIIDYQNKKASGQVEEKEELKNRLFLQKMIHYLKEYEVENPYADKIKLPPNIKKKRRLNELFQSFIKIVTLLHQRQRTIRNGRLISEIEDIENAIEILFEGIVLKADELDGSLRQFYEKLKKYVEKKGNKTEFTQLEIRQNLNISKTGLHRYMNDLLQLEYIQIVGGHINKGYKYKINYWDDYKKLREEIKNNLLEQIRSIREHKNKTNNDEQIENIKEIGTHRNANGTQGISINTGVLV